MRAAAVLWVASLFACSPSERALDLTMSFDEATVSDAALARVETITIRASGDEDHVYPIVPGRSVMRTERVVYRYASTTHSLAIDVDATDAMGIVVATGVAGPVSISGTQAMHVTLTASVVVGPDLGGPPDLATADLSVPADLALPVDMAQSSPTFINGTLANTANGSSVTASRPVGSEVGSLLLALVGGVYPTAQTPVSLSPPAGWSLLTTSSAPGPQPATATWFWRYVVSGEPTSYVFTRSDTGPIFTYLAAYAGTVDLGSGPFEGPSTLSNASSTTATFPSVTLSTHATLVVLNGFAPDSLDDTWSTPSGLVVCQGAEVLCAHVEVDSYGAPYPSVTSTLSTASRTLTFATGLRGVIGP